MIGRVYCDRSSLLGRSLFLRDEERLQRDPSVGSPKACVPCPLFATHNRVGEDAGGGPPVSSNYDKFLNGIGRQRTQGFLPPILQQGDRLAQVVQALHASP